MKKLLLPLIVLLTLAGGKANAQCNALFSYYISLTNPQVVSFFDSSFVNGPTTYQWNFGDASFDSVQNPVHNYLLTGVYNVCLTVTDSIGCTDVFCDSINVTTPTPFLSLYYFDVDSMNLYSCTSPASVGFYYYANVTGFAPGDSVLFEVKYGDGTDSLFYVTVGGGNFQGMLTHIYLNGGNYTGELIMSGAGLTDTVNSSTIVVASTCGTITGTVYNDLNGNCIKDNGEELPNISLSIYNGATLMGWTNSDVNGLYSFNVPTGSSYDIHVNASGGYIGHFTPTCPSSGILTVNTIPSAGNNIGVACPAGYDLKGNVSAWGFRPGFTASVCVFAYNQRCNTPSGQIVITFPTGLNPLPDSGGSGYTIVGNTVSYSINGPDLSWSFCIPVAVSTSLLIGDTVCIDMNITPVTGDSVPSNNTGTFCFPVRNSYDPNDKYAVPTGEGIQGYILPNTDLTYTIRFQNTGNAEAINIYILDTLDADLDASSVELVGFSHPANMSLLSGNILRFNFDNINLPDSNTNEPASHGYVSYRIKQGSNIPQLGQITNTAGIYFDFNPPIITNTTLHTVDMFLAVNDIQNNDLNVVLYPNPANEKCYLNFDDSHLKTISVLDVVGKEVYRNRFTSNSYILDTDKLSEGIYTIRVTDNANRTSVNKLLISR